MVGSVPNTIFRRAGGTFPEIVINRKQQHSLLVSGYADLHGILSCHRGGGEKSVFVYRFREGHNGTVVCFAVDLCDCFDCGSGCTLCREERYGNLHPTVKIPDNGAENRGR